MAVYINQWMPPRKVVGIPRATTRFSRVWKMSKLAPDRMAEHVSRDQFHRRANGDREMFIFRVQLTTSRIVNLTRLNYALLLAITIH